MSARVTLSIRAASPRSSRSCSPSRRRQPGAPSPTYAWGTNTFARPSEKQLVALTTRRAPPPACKALRVDSTLTSIARGRSKDMIVRDYFSHDIPGERQRLRDHEPRATASARRREHRLNNYPGRRRDRRDPPAFMGSVGHRANILGKDYD